ncbi:hypothetical protein C0Z01_14195 [Photobacterium kishitanii]|uniref:replication endonuclease n=1 Tax=Photobacterium kishitanii TaxID=318456 RepID=UPI0007F01815|nr:replication endonuclease [Photobacterium kishitanii]OBU24961.1 hypothetical protein AYY22_21040 [Photobacterium kishitanii]PSW68707.1 hypothetical protein C0Z01_14195 [Photobacterium kishitanii]
MITIKAKKHNADMFFSDSSNSDLSEIRIEDSFQCDIEAHNAKAFDSFSISRLSVKQSNKLKMLPYQLRSALASEVVRGRNSVNGYERLIDFCGDVFNYPSDIVKGIDSLVAKQVRNYGIDSAIKYAQKKQEQLNKAFSFPVDWRLISTTVKRAMFADKQAGLALSILNDVTGKTPREVVLFMIDRLSAFEWGVCAFDVDCDPYDSKYLLMISYFIDSAWWQRKIDKAYISSCENARRVAGLVGNEESVYASIVAVDWYKQKQAQTEKWLKTIVMRNSAGLAISMFDIHQASLANPENRRNELMVRINGMQEHADSMGLNGLFITMTTPSRFHAMKKHGKNYIENDKFDGSTVKDGQEWLKKRWSLIRSAWNDAGISPLGLRVAEPHKDGTVHWHMLVFVSPDLKETALSIFKHYMFCLNKYPNKFINDRDELKSVNQFNARFLSKEIDPKKGSAAAYVAKYISKNINASSVEKLPENESGKTLSSLISNVNAWCRIASIRQFQMFGMPSITIWRELRRLHSESDSEVINLFRQATGIKGSEDKPNFWSFIKLGMKFGYPELVKGITENSRGMEVETIVGVQHGLTFEQTHFNGEWLKDKASKEVIKAINDRFVAAGKNDVEAVFDSLAAIALALDIEGKDCPSWTSGTNCRIPKVISVNGRSFTLDDAIKAHDLRMKEHENEEIVYFEFED